MGCKELFFRDNKFKFCFYDDKYIKNCLSIAVLKSIYWENSCPRFREWIDLCCDDTPLQNVYYIFCLIFFIAPLFSFIVVTFFMVILFVCLVTPTLFICLLRKI
jgi:hypothetical protein